MRIIGLLLIGVGFLAGSLVAVQSADNTVSWELFTPALILGAVGVVLARASQRSATATPGSLPLSETALEDSVKRIVDHLEALKTRDVDWHPGQFHGWVDQHLRADLKLFAANRRAMITSRGLSHYASVMSEFAAGERYVNRVWSASVDGYIDEVHAYLDRALEQFQRTQELLAQ